VLDELRLYEPGQPPAPPGDRHRVLVARKPGVMDPVALTVERALRRSGLDGGAGGAVGTYRAWELSGELDPGELDRIGRSVLGNDIIEVVLVRSEALPYGPPPEARIHGRVDVPLLEADDGALERLSAAGGLALDLMEMRAIQASTASTRPSPQRWSSTAGATRTCSARPSSAPPASWRVPGA
jgi:phosphoribosylformylglycinamidine (FGAM) synthase PurS component